MPAKFLFKTVSIALISVLALLIGCNNQTGPSSTISVVKEGEQDIQVQNFLPPQAYPKSALLPPVSLKKEHPSLNDAPPAHESPEYVFLASTLGAPRKVVSQKPYWQGAEKIVHLRFEKKTLKVFQSDQDSRFSPNPINEIPIMTIPIKHTSHTSPSSKNNWQEAPYFIADFNRLTLSHLGLLDIITKDNCFGQISQKAIRAEITDSVMNIEIEREYELKNIDSCIIKHLDNNSFNFNITTPSFKIRYFYSMVRLSKLASKDYQPVEYPIKDQQRFGFLASKVPSPESEYGPLQTPEVFYLDRFKPGKDQTNWIDYHLSDSFNKAENLYLREATHRNIESINHALERAGAKLQINLVHAESKETEKSSGDLRYNTIVLIEEPIANGIIGYGPHVRNPRTGEILQAHTNMYLGTIKKIAKNIYQKMARKSKREKSKKLAQNKPIPNKQQDKQPLQKLPENLSLLEDEYQNSKNQLYTQTLPSVSIEDLQKKEYLQSLHYQEIQNSNYGDYMDRENFEAIQRDLEAQENFIRLHAKNHAYHAKMLDMVEMGDSITREIINISDVMDEKGILKPWEELSKEQQEQVSKTIISAVYSTTFIHEIGHNLGLRHNFMGSVDRRNFYTKKESEELGLTFVPQTSSIMDYNIDDLKSLNTLGKYDIAALRYGYARQVELSNKQLVPISSTLENLEKELKLSHSRKTAKRYSYCTDGQAGKTPLCNYFDHGTTLLEIAQFYTNSYKNNYYARNWRNDRKNFSELDLPKYIAQNMRLFRNLRMIFGQFELYSYHYGTLGTRGCTNQEYFQAPSLCQALSDARNSAIAVGKFFLDILKTPDLTCALKPMIGSPNTKEKLVTLKSVLKSLPKNNLSQHIPPQSCFDENIQKYLKSSQNYLRQSFVVQGETGKYINSLRETNISQYPHRFAISVRGIWSDKLLAMRYLTIRLDEVTLKKYPGRKNIAESVLMKKHFDNFLNHLISKEKLLNPIKFKDSEGKEYVKDHSQLAVTNYMIARQNNPYLALYMGLPPFDKGYLNQALISNAFRANRLGGFDEEGSSEQTFQNELTVISTRRTTPVNLEQEDDIVIGQTRYIIGKENRLAYLLYQLREGQKTLENIPLETAKAIFTKRTVPPRTTDIHLDTVLKDIPLEKIKYLMKFLAQSSQPRPMSLYYPPYSSAMKLGVEGLQIALDILREMHIAPQFATDDERAAYLVELDVLKEFIDGNLKKRSENLEVGLQKVLQKIPL